MMKKIFGILTALIIFSSNCLAMTFSQPIKIGEISYNAGPNGGVEIIGATNIKNYSTVQNPRFYGKGIARFGNSLYLYFNDEYFRQHFTRYRTELTKKVSRFGGQDIKNSVAIFTLEGKTDIYQVKNDGGIELYLAKTETGAGGTIQVFGTTKEGKWVKYFDVSDVRKSFGIPRSNYIDNFFVADDEIILQIAPGRREQSCEIRYKWDDKAKWFGVEQKTCADLLADMRRNPSNYYCFGGGGTGLSYWFDKNSVRAKKNNDGCIISVRSVNYFSVAGANPHVYTQYKAPTTYFPIRFSYNFKTKKIYAEKIERDHSVKWEMVRTATRGREDRNLLSLAEQIFYIAYGRNFFDKPYSYQGSPTPRGLNF